MTAHLAIGVGCRKGCAAAAIAALVRDACEGEVPDRTRAALFTLADKAGEAGLHAAAASLDLVFLPREALDAAMPDVVTRSAAALARFGVASVAEAAALAGAGPGARLVVVRMARAGATVALAVCPDRSATS